MRCLNRAEVTLFKKQNKMTFITKGNKLFYAACAAFFSIPDGYIRDLQW